MECIYSSEHLNSDESDTGQAGIKFVHQRTKGLRSQPRFPQNNALIICRESSLQSIRDRIYPRHSRAAIRV